MEQNSFHQRENKFPLARMKGLLKNKFILDGKSFNLKLEQNGFHQPENQFPLATMKGLLKNKFTLDGKSFN